MAGLARHVDTDGLLKILHDRPLHQAATKADGSVFNATSFSSRYSSGTELSKFRIPHEGVDAGVAYQLLKDELDLDGKPSLNLASFVSTYMEPEVDKLMAENMSKNLADADEYPALMDLHARCISIIADLWKVQKGEKAIGSATTGSSEAIQLGGMAMKRRWQERRRANGKDSSKPNIIMGANAQVALEKFARYFEVEARIFPVLEKSHHCLDPELVKRNIDENTIGICVIIGSTYTGHYEPVEEISNILDEYEKETGISIDIHVDAASGGFIAPFVHGGAGFKWNFELPRVKSINSSGHKFGLVYPELGWIIWRDESYLPKHLIFELYYLGGTEDSFTLNFSRPGAQVIAQYYNLIHLGFTGYRNIMENVLSNARLLSRALECTGWYQCVSDIHRKRGDFKYKEGKPQYVQSNSSAEYNAGLPVVAFRFSDSFQKQYPNIRQETVSKLLRGRQYIIPNYPLPPNEDSTDILRIVVRENLSLDMIDHLVADICSVTESLMQSDKIDLQSLQPFTSIEKRHASAGLLAKHKHKARQPMKKGVHRSVC